jgi:hypothetical protein
MGDMDPPPSLPLGTEPVNSSEPTHVVNQASTLPVQQPVSKEEHSTSNDPPPAPPSSLLSAVQ